MEDDNLQENKTYSKVTFTENDLANREFVDCTFSHCILAGIDLQKCSFNTCTFDNCDLSLLKVKGCTFNKVTISNCKAIGIQWYDARNSPFAVSFKGSN